MTISSQNELIDIIASRAKFTKGDVKKILDELVGVFEEAVRESNIQPNEKGKTLIKVRGLGKLYLQGIPERKGRNGETLAFTTRTVFRLSENIKNANKILVDTDLDENE